MVLPILLAPLGLDTDAGVAMSNTRPEHNASAERPTIAEVAALTRRLRELSRAGAGADPAERAAFLADKAALLARITDPSDPAARES